MLSIWIEIKDGYFLFWPSIVSRANFFNGAILNTLPAKAVMVNIFPLPRIFSTLSETRKREICFCLQDTSNYAVKHL